MRSHSVTSHPGACRLVGAVSLANIQNIQNIQLTLILNNFSTTPAENFTSLFQTPFTRSILTNSIKMPGEVIDRPNPQPIASHVPDDVLALVVKLEKTKLDEHTYEGLQHFRRAANYIAACM